MADKIYIPLSQYLADTSIPTDLVTSFTPEFLDYIALDDGHIFVDGTDKNARLYLTVMKALEVEFSSGIKAGVGKGQVLLEFTNNEDEWSFRAFIEKFHFEIAVLKIQQDVSTMLFISKTQDVQEYEFSIKNLVIGSFTATEVTVALLFADGANAGSITFDTSWDIIKNRLQALPANVPRPDNDETLIETLVEWDESDANKTVHVNLKVELAELANSFFDFLPVDVRPDVLSWELRIDTVYEGQGTKTGYDVFQEDTATSQLTGDIYAAIELLLPEKLSSIKDDVFEVHFGDSTSIIRAHLAINGINSGDTKFHFDIEDPVSIIIHIDQNAGADPLKIYFSRFSLDKSTGSGSLKFEGHFIYGNLSGSSVFEFSLSPTTTSLIGDLTLGYYLDDFQVETELHVDFGTAQTSADPITVDDSSANVRGKISFSKIKIGNDDIYAKLADASFGFDYSRTAGKPSFKIQAGIDVLFQLSSKGLDGFLTKVLPSTPIQFPFQNKFDWSMDQQAAAASTSGTTPVTQPGTPGISSSSNILQSLQQTTTSQRASGGLNMSFLIPTHIDIGPLEIQSAVIAIKPGPEKISLEIGVIVKGNLGPLTAVIENMGLKAEFTFPPSGGNLGPLQLAVGFKPPNGVGLSLDTGVIKGGGFLRMDVENGQYFGALELSIKDKISLKAVGIINTKMPDGSQGFALLILITAEFTPIQLGFGFSLMGVGGLLGLNRSTNIEVLKTGVKTGAVSSILFPEDVVANITRIISDLTAIFPIVDSHFIIAPMGKIGWFVPPLITLELGIVIDIPSPTLVIIGVLRCLLPEEKSPILKLQVNFAGGIDFYKGLIWFDASLFDSSILIYTLTGDMALRIGWGDNPLFILSVGGFHPAYHEVPPDLTAMSRLTIAMLSGNNPRLTAQSYFAVTSNTVQSGAKVELYAEACGFNVYGFLGYDLLVQFLPFYFIADISAGLALRSGTDEIAGINVHCELSGPTPWHALGDASLKILFFKITVGFDQTWGDSAPPQILEAEDVLKLVVDAVKDSRNWKADIPANMNLNVSIKKIDLPSEEIVLHPFGILSVSQKVVPLQLTINKFGNKKPAADTLFDITYGGGSTVYAEEEFAPANFVQMNDSDKLSRKSFEKMKSGLGFQGSDTTSHGFEIDKDVKYELIYVHKRKQLSIKGGIIRLFASVFAATAKGNAISKNSYSFSKKKATNAPARIEVSQQGYSVVNVSDMEIHPGTSTIASEAEAYMIHDALIAKNPSLKGSIQVVSNSECN